MAKRMSLCVDCEAEIWSGERGRLPTRCGPCLQGSRAVKGRVLSRKEIAQRAAAARWDGHVKTSEYAPRSMVAFPECVVCGRVFSAKASHAKYCGKACSNVVQAARQRRVAAESGEYQSTRWRRENGRTYATYKIVCEHCGVDAEVKKRSGRYCSAKCFADARAVRRAEELSARSQLVYVGPAAPRSELPRLHPARRPSEGRMEWFKFFVQGPCAWCGGDFTDRASSLETMTRFCSKRCQNRAGKVGRERFVISPVTRRAIYERDVWKCQLCGKRVGKKFPPSHNRAPSLDHIVPRSLGGSDDPSNLQLAHRICNSRKVAQVWGDGEQLMLLSEVA